MQSILDEGYTWMIGCISYADELSIVVIEGTRSKQAQVIKLANHEIGPGYLIEYPDDARRAVVTFQWEGLIAWQVVNESYTAFDQYEVREGAGKLQTITRSKYLDYVNESHGWYNAMVGPAKQYRVWTQNEVVDVVATQPPMVSWWNEGY